MSVEEMVVYYARFLDRNEYCRHLKRFSHRLKADPPAARAEAVVFQVLWAEDLHPDIFEDNSTGGPDFCCKPETDNSFLIEVASLNSAALSARTKLPLRIEGPGGGAYGMITEKLFSVVKTKAAQLGNYTQPRVLAITCEYDFASLLMNRPAAQYALGSRPHFEVPIGGKSKDGVWTWDEKGGIFWSPSKLVNASGYQDLIPRYQSVSAVLLISTYPRESQILGILHPEPAHAFDPGWLPSVPFVRFKDWPVLNGQIQLGWNLEGHAVFPHRHLC